MIPTSIEELAQQMESGECTASAMLQLKAFKDKLIDRINEKALLSQIKQRIERILYKGFKPAICSTLIKYYRRKVNG